MERVSVIGCPGAGKTTFARELARITGLPLIHLDRMYHDQAYSYQTDKSSWRAIKRRIHFHRKVREDMPSTWKERLGWDFFLFILKFNRSIAPSMHQLLKSYTDKDIIILRSPHQAKKYLAKATP